MNASLWGKAAIVLSAVFFYSATFVIKKGSSLSIPVIYFAFARFFLGFLFFSIRQSSIEKKQYISIFWIRMRAFWNLVAVYFFFFGISYGSVTNANILNMAYPAFVAFFAAVLIKERLSVYEIIALVFVLIGVFVYIFDSGLHSFQWGDILSFLSAVTAGVSIVSLRQARKTDSSHDILYYQFFFGSILSLFLLVYAWFYLPCDCSFRIIIYLSLSAFFGVFGQILLTNGFRYVKATEGAILSSSRIWIALAVGIIVLNESYSYARWAGGAAIFAANILAGLGGNKKT